MNPSADSLNHAYISGSPSVITLMINEFLNFGSQPADNVRQYVLLFWDEVFVQEILVAVAIIMIPVMLLVKPIHFKITSSSHHYPSQI